MWTWEVEKPSLLAISASNPYLSVYVVGLKEEGSYVGRPSDLGASSHPEAGCEPRSISFHSLAHYHSVSLASQLWVTLQRVCVHLCVQGCVCTPAGVHMENMILRSVLTFLTREFPVRSDLHKLH